MQYVSCLWNLLTVCLLHLLTMYCPRCDFFRDVYGSRHHRTCLGCTCATFRLLLNFWGVRPVHKGARLCTRVPTSLCVRVASRRKDVLVADLLNYAVTRMHSAVRTAGSSLLFLSSSVLCCDFFKPHIVLCYILFWISCCPAFLPPSHSSLILLLLRLCGAHGGNLGLFRGVRGAEREGVHDFEEWIPSRISGKDHGGVVEQADRGYQMNNSPLPDTVAGLGRIDSSRTNSRFQA